MMTILEDSAYSVTPKKANSVDIHVYGLFH